MERKCRIIFAAFIAAAWIALVYFCTGIFFETNDDRLLGEILSGAMTGSPEAHTYYVNYILALPITLLYHIKADFPWYGCVLVLFQFLCWFFLTDAFLSRCRNKWEVIYALALCVVLYSAGVYIIGEIQFTSTAAFLAIDGYLCYLLYAERKRRLASFFLLEFLSFLLRDKSMLMICPMGVAVLIGYFASEHISSIRSSDRKETFFQKHKPIIEAVFILLIIFVLGEGSKLAAYRSPGWKEYSRINDAVTEITDFSGIPEYQDVKHILDQYGVTEKQYMAFFQYTMIENNLSGDCLTEIAEIAQKQRARPSFEQILKNLLESYSTKEYWGLDSLLVAIWIVLLFYILLRKAYSLLLPLLGLFFSRSILWIYLLYEGRTPFRVMVPLYLGEMALLLCLLFLDSLRGGRDMKLFLPLLVLPILFFSAKSLKGQYRYLIETNGHEAVYIKGMEEMLAYCGSHPEKRYFIDASALIYYRGSAFESGIYGPRNGITTGCWYSGAPVLYQHIEDYLKDCDSLYLITAEEMEMQSGMVIDYLEERFDTDALLEDTFVVSNGGKYLVYRFSVC